MILRSRSHAEPPITLASIASALDGPTASARSRWAAVWAAIAVVGACVGVYLFVL